MIFRLDSYPAKQMVELFGEKKVQDKNRGISFGAHEVRDGVSLTDRQRVQPIVTPRDLMQQAKLQAYVKFSGDLPMTQVQFPLGEYPDQGAHFIAKENR